jgi:methionyl-tRNA formyltransferase
MNSTPLKFRLLPAAGKIFRIIKSNIYVNETLILYEHDKNTYQETVAKITYITPENVSDVLDFQHPRYKPTFEEFLRCGDTGYFAYLMGKCVHRSWVVHMPQKVHLHPMLPKQLREGEAFIHYCETAPHARGRNIYPAVLSKIADDFEKDGRTLMISANAKNSSSIKGIVKSGFLERERENHSGPRNQVPKTLQVVVITMGISPIVKPLLQSRHNVAGIIECAPRSRSEIKKEKVFYQTARRIYSKLRKTPLRLAGLAKEKSIPYYYMAEGSSLDLEDWVKSLNPDLIVVFSMSQLLKKNIFSIPHYGTINLHPSLLPRYRGPNPWFWMYHDQDLHPGVTVHYIDEGEDTGDIIYQEGFDIQVGAAFQEVNRKAIDDVGVKLLIRAIDDIATGSAPRRPQLQGSPTKRARNVQPDEGSSLIEWEKWPVQRVWHFLRGAAQWTKILPEIEGIYKGQRYELSEYETCPMESDCKPGNVYSESGCNFLACRDGKINLRKSFSVKLFIMHRLLS